MHPFRFGLTAGWVRSGDAWMAMARRGEELGYAVLLVPDHLTGQLSPVPALAAAAAVTTRLRIGSYVFANDFRHPLVLAREAATLDVLSNGRMEFGLGAGWRVSDYTQLGVPYDRAGLRIDRFEESVGLVARLLSGEVVTHVGHHYRLTRARVAPVPVQRPRPPIHVGGGGPRLLRIAARTADIVGFVPQFDAHGRPMLSHATEGALARKVAVVREAAGDHFERLELNLFLALAGMVGSGSGPVASLASAGLAGAGGIIRSPYVLHGTKSRLRDVLERRRERFGISYYSIPQDAMEAMAPLVEDLAGR